MPSEELRQRSDPTRREPLRTVESFDPFDPRSNDEGGLYGTGVIGQTYYQGSVSQNEMN